jgi:hypothetical protein
MSNYKVVHHIFYARKTQLFESYGAMLLGIFIILDGLFYILGLSNELSELVLLSTYAFYF